MVATIGGFNARNLVDAKTLDQQKAQLRARLKAARAQIPLETRVAGSRAIVTRLFDLPQMDTARTIFSYISYRTEVHTRELIDRLMSQGVTVLVPKLLDATTMQAHPFTSWAELQPEALGILAPVGTEEYPGPIDLVLTPGLGFTERGQRLGFGAGYYDRWFAQHRVAGKVALGFEAQIVDDIPSDEFDIPVDLLVTERRTLRPRLSQ